MYLQENRKYTLLRWHSPQTVSTSHSIQPYKITIIIISVADTGARIEEFKIWLPINLLIDFIN